MKNDGKPIIACSSGTREDCAIAVIRISGFTSLSQLNDFFKNPLDDYNARRIYSNILISDKYDIDNVLLSFFASPKSYTGENMIEIYVHGNQVNVKSVINLFCDSRKFFLAEPGEFTYRAYKNGKLSLSQVEGLELFLNAKNPISAQTGFSLLQGELHKKYLSLRNNFLQLKGSLELLIDFSEDVGDEQGWNNLKKLSSHFNSELVELFHRSHFAGQSLLSPKIVLFGATNAGKSTLFNKLVSFERSIVSDEMGTTRDYITEPLKINDVIFSLIDTAGIRGTDSELEQEGIERSYQQFDNAFYRVLVINPLQGFELPKQLEFDCCVFTHGDLPKAKSLADKFSKQISIPHLTYSGPIGPTGSIGPLFDLVYDKYQKLSEQRPILVERHRNAISELHSNYQRYFNALQNEDDLGILDSLLENVHGSIEQLIGIISPDEVLASIFANYCIGK